MNIEQTTFGDLNQRTARRLVGDDLTSTSRVFVARSGNRIVGTATVRHNQGTQRDLQVNVRARSTSVREALTAAVREQTRYLKRATRFT